MCLAVPGKVISLNVAEQIMLTGKVSFGGVIKDVNLAYITDIRVGDYVIVHAGFALNKIDEREAKTVFNYLEQLTEQSDSSDNKP